MQKRHRFKQARTLEQRLADEAQKLRKRAEQLPSGFERESMLRRARQDEIAIHLAEWLTSPGLRPPT